MLHRVRVRTTRAADGTIVETVRCHPHDRVVDVEDCLACPARVGYKLDPSAGEAWIVCANGARDAAPRARRARRPP